jgi:LmbE family N-acetylglucosaminyl deacetylase
MLTLTSSQRVETILCLGAHGDDIEIGCGGTLLKLLAQWNGVAVHWVVFSSTPERVSEVEDSARCFVGDKMARVVVESFRDGYFPHYGAEIKDRFEALKHDITPDLILTHRRADAHQDHRLIGELTQQTFRDHAILEYEIPKFDGDLETPNLYVELSGEVVDRKIRHLLDVFATQRSRHWFTDETFRSMLRLRGIECRARDGYAEGFHCRKLVLA